MITAFFYEIMLGFSLPLEELGEVEYDYHFICKNPSDKIRAILFMGMPRTLKVICM